MIVHAIMLAVMAGTMVVHSAVLSLLGAGLLIATSVVCAALSRSRPALQAHVLDLWAMALTLVVFLPVDARPEGHHVVTLPALGAFAVVAASWAAARIWLAVRRRPHAWTRVVASAGLTAAGLAVMAALCV